MMRYTTRTYAPNGEMMVDDAGEPFESARDTEHRAFLSARSWPWPEGTVITVQTVPRKIMGTRLMSPTHVTVRRRWDGAEWVDIEETDAGGSDGGRRGGRRAKPGRAGGVTAAEAGG